MILDFFYEHYWLILIIMIILPMMVQSNVQKTTMKYSKVRNENGLTGKEVAQIILDKEGITDVQILPISGQLTDNYNPGKKTLNLSESVYNDDSVTAAAIAAHEVGHAIQHQKHYSGLTFRNFVFPFAQFGSRVAGISILIGIIAQATNWLYFGIIALIFIFIFQLATLPVEFNASSRAMNRLQKYNLVSDEHVEAAGEVLKTASLTYLTAALVSLLNILRLLAVARNND